MSQSSTCSHCGSPIARGHAAQWTIRLCALGRRKRVFYLCTPCDIAINRHMLIAMGHPKVNVTMERYARG